MLLFLLEVIDSIPSLYNSFNKGNQLRIICPVGLNRKINSLCVT
jgi:hypothetical protein